MSLHYNSWLLVNFLDVRNKFLTDVDSEFAVLFLRSRQYHHDLEPYQPSTLILVGFPYVGCFTNHSHSIWSNSCYIFPIKADDLFLAVDDLGSCESARRSIEPDDVEELLTGAEAFFFSIFNQMNGDLINLFAHEC